MNCQGQARVCEAARRAVGTAPPSGPLSTSARDWEFLSALEHLRAALAEARCPGAPGAETSQAAEETGI